MDAREGWGEMEGEEVGWGRIRGRVTLPLPLRARKTFIASRPAEEPNCEEVDDDGRRGEKEGERGVGERPIAFVRARKRER